MVHQPPILILDEPTAGVDVDLEKIYGKIKELNKIGNNYSHNSLSFEARECERIYINKGNLVALDTTKV